MDRFERSAEALARVDSDLRAEAAAALGRIAARLEALLHELRRIREDLDALGEAERARAIDAYDALRRQARVHRWYLEVQREALGLLRHDDLDRFYPVPRPLRSRRY